MIKALSENTSSSEDLGCEHGLSLYLEAGDRKILFDTGAGSLFAENAEKLRVDLSSVELAVLSHGHYDHGGGLREFLKRNARASVYLHRRAFEEHLARRLSGAEVYIGLDQTLLPNDRFIMTGDHFVIEEGLELFSGVSAEKLRPSGNRTLLMRQSGQTPVPDDFAHEQNLIVRENGKLLLVAGCAHCGIVNILERFHTLEGRYPDLAVGGFHLSNPSSGQSEDPAVVKEIGAFLQGTGSMYATCHCTGQESFQILKEILGDKLVYLSAGVKIEI